LRTLHLVDLDSLVGGAARRDYGRRAGEAIRRYHQAASIQPLDDVVLVGLDVAILDDGCLFIRRLPSGEILTFCDCAVLYDQVVVASGSAQFEPVIDQLVYHGTPVVVASPAEDAVMVVRPDDAHPGLWRAMPRNGPRRLPRTRRMSGR
jgi:hypothetical protein